MGKIKRYNKGHCEYNVCGMHEHTDGNWVSFEDHQQSLTEAKKEGVREFLTKIRDHCRDETICDGCPMVHIDMVHIDCNNMSKATDEDIKKVVRGYEREILRYQIDKR